MGKEHRERKAKEGKGKQKKGKERARKKERTGEKGLEQRERSVCYRSLPVIIRLATKT